MSLVRFACPCGVSLQVPPVLAGHVGRCPVCARTLTVPGPPRPAPSPHAMVRVDCPCGRRIPAPQARVHAGEARCPSCDRVLAV